MFAFIEISFIGIEYCFAQGFCAREGSRPADIHVGCLRRGAANVTQQIPEIDEFIADFQVALERIQSQLRKCSNNRCLRAIESRTDQEYFQFVTNGALGVKLD